MSEEYIVYGCGGHARSVADVILSNSEQVHITFVDEAAQPGEKIFGFDVVPAAPQSPETAHFLAIGDNARRKTLNDALGVRMQEIIAANAYVGREASVGAGSFVGHEAYIGPDAKIGENCIINTRAIIEHEVVVGDFAQIAPGVIIGGRTKIGESAFIGLGAVILDGLTICPGVIIGASAVVIDSIDEPGTYVGVPARKVSG